MELKTVLKNTVVVLFTILISAQADTLNERSFNLISSWPFGGPARAIAIDTINDRAYYGSGMGVYTLDISTPGSPVKISEAIHTSNSVNELCYNNDRLYVMAKGKGIEIWDVSTPTAPYFLGRMEMQGDLPKAKQSGNYLYVANGNYGLIIIDVSNPANPYEVGSYVSGTYISSLCLSGDYAC